MCFGTSRQRRLGERSSSRVCGAPAVPMPRFPLLLSFIRLNQPLLNVQKSRSLLADCCPNADIPSIRDYKIVIDTNAKTSVRIIQVPAACCSVDKKAKATGGRLIVVDDLLKVVSWCGPADMEQHS